MKYWKDLNHKKIRVKSPICPFSSGTESGSDLFTINDVTGELKGHNLDREKLETSSFSISIKATEILDDGSIAPDQETVSQVQNITNF